MTFNLIFGFLLGAILGSFIAATAYRLIKSQRLGGRSYCESCKKQLEFLDLIPILSYVLLSGKCRYCKNKIRLENFLTEIVLGVIIALVFSFFTFSPIQIAFTLFTVVVLAIVFIVDLKSGYIFDKVTYPAITIAFLYRFYQGVSGNWNELWWALGSATGSALLFTSLIIITRGKGMGWGDVKYVLFLGLALGFPQILVGLLLSFLFGSVISIALIALGKKSFGQTVPFGPFLSLGALISLIWGETLFSWYLTAL